MSKPKSSQGCGPGEGCCWGEKTCDWPRRTEWGQEVSCVTEVKGDSHFDQACTYGEQEKSRLSKCQVTSRFLVIAAGVQEEKMEWGDLWSEAYELSMPGMPPNGMTWTTAGPPRI